MLDDAVWHETGKAIYGMKQSQQVHTILLSCRVMDDEEGNGLEPVKIKIKVSYSIVSKAHLVIWKN